MSTPLCQTNNFSAAIMVGEPEETFPLPKITVMPVARENFGAFGKGIEKCKSDKQGTLGTRSKSGMT